MWGGRTPSNARGAGFGRQATAYFNVVTIGEKKSQLRASTMERRQSNNNILSDPLDEQVAGNASRGSERPERERLGRTRRFRYGRHR